jgi:hypothetical protein
VAQVIDNGGGGGAKHQVVVVDPKFAMHFSFVDNPIILTFDFFLPYNYYHYLLRTIENNIQYEELSNYRPPHHGPRCLRIGLCTRRTCRPGCPIKDK